MTCSNNLLATTLSLMLVLGLAAWPLGAVAQEDEDGRAWNRTQLSQPWEGWVNAGTWHYVESGDSHALGYSGAVGVVAPGGTLRSSSSLEVSDVDSSTGDTRSTRSSVDIHYERDTGRFAIHSSSGGGRSRVDGSEDRGRSFSEVRGDLHPGGRVSTGHEGRRTSRRKR